VIISARNQSRTMVQSDGTSDERHILLKNIGTTQYIVSTWTEILYVIAPLASLQPKISFRSTQGGHWSHALQLDTGMHIHT
jgi:hypothetical protein